MKMLVFGSLNIDHVYQVDHFVREGETLGSLAYMKNAGGKGFNQAVALAKAGQETWFAGAIGEDGQFLKAQLEALNVRTDDLYLLPTPTGHAMIQVDAQGRNSIILYGGANQQLSLEMIEQTLSHCNAGDYVLIQNEISHGDEIIRQAAARGIHVVLNPSPVSKALLEWPLELVDWFILNEIEGGDISGQSDPQNVLDEMLRRFPGCHVVLTLGSRGAIYADANQRITQESFPVKAVDTTAAGDTFTGYFLQGVLSGATIQLALKRAAQASAITVSRPGAGTSIPFADELAG